MALAKTNQCEPPNILEGENGLWDIYRRSTMHVLALKLMEDLADCGVGTNQVEAEAKHREKQRRIKLGKAVDGLVYEGERCGERDEAYIKGLMKLRGDQVREDWKFLREKMKQEKERIRKSVKNERELNLFKRMMERIQRKNEELYLKGRKKHAEKIKWLKRKHKHREKPKGKLTPESREEWLKKIAIGRTVVSDSSIPMYGDVPELPVHAKKVLQLPVKLKVPDKVTTLGVKYEAETNNCKTR